MFNIRKIVKKADFIINGYAFIKKRSLVNVINLRDPAFTAVIDKSGDVIEKTVPDDELEIILEYYRKNKKTILKKITVTEILLSLFLMLGVMLIVYSCMAGVKIDVKQIVNDTPKAVESILELMYMSRSINFYENMEEKCHEYSADSLVYLNENYPDDNFTYANNGFFHINDVAHSYTEELGFRTRYFELSFVSEKYGKKFKVYIYPSSENEKRKLIYDDFHDNYFKLCLSEEIEDYFTDDVDRYFETDVKSKVNVSLLQSDIIQISPVASVDEYINKGGTVVFTLFGIANFDEIDDKLKDFSLYLKDSDIHARVDYYLINAELLDNNSADSLLRINYLQKQSIRYNVYGKYNEIYREE